MYLTKKIYLGVDYANKKNGTSVEIEMDKNNNILEEVGYWRKANQIHKWFVDNVQNGLDDCAEYYVSREKLKELLDTCIKVKENHGLAKKLLPVCNGFFFGSNEYDEYYYADIDDTINILQKIFKNINSGVTDYYYSSSW